MIEDRILLSESRWILRQPGWFFNGRVQGWGRALEGVESSLQSQIVVCGLASSCWGPHLVEQLLDHAGGSHIVHDRVRANDLSSWGEVGSLLDLLESGGRGEDKPA